MKRILVADDSETVSMLVSTALSNEGYSVTTVDNGMAAFSVGSEQPIDLAIIDQLMPGMSSTEAPAAANACCTMPSGARIFTPSKSATLSIGTEDGIASAGCAAAPMKWTP